MISCFKRFWNFIKKLFGWFDVDIKSPQNDDDVQKSYTSQRKY